MTRQKSRVARPRSAKIDPSPRVSAATSMTTSSDYPGWRWRTFPVFAALAAGMLIAFVVNEGSVNPVAFVLQMFAVLGVGYALAHIVVVNVIGAGRMRRRRAAVERGETPDEDLEDVVVFEDEAQPL